MRSPFPGMDPFLERPDLWPDVHLELIRAIRAELTRVLAPKYVVAVEQRVYTASIDLELYLGRPDVAVLDPRSAPRSSTREAAAPYPASPVVVDLPVAEEVREHYLAVRAAADHRVITVLEVLSPTNKVPGEGRTQYLRKRDRVLASTVHLLEIDLLRGGLPMPMSPRPVGDYRIVVSRAPDRPKAHLFAFGVRDSIPLVPVPVAVGDAEPSLDLGALLAECYAAARYDLRVDYAEEPVPPLAGDDAIWVADRARRTQA